MQIRYYSLLLVPLLALAGCDQMKSVTGGNNTATATATTDSSVPDTSPVVATVNGQPLTQAVLDVYAGQRIAKGAEDADPDTMLNELITLELVRQEAQSKGLDKLPVVVASLNQLQRSALAGAGIKDYMEKHPVSDEEVKAYYDQNVGKPGKEFKARHILVDKEEDARAIVSMLDSGKDFSELAKEKSTDSSGKNGGTLPWFSAGMMVKEFSDATEALEKGSYTKTPVQTQFGWHVILLDDVRDSTPPPFDDVKDRIRVGLSNQSLQKHLLELRQTAKVDVVDSNGSEPAEHENMSEEDKEPASDEDRSEEDKEPASDEDRSEEDSAQESK